MDVEFRALYIDSPIALPLAEDCGPLTDMSATPPDWKNMAEPMFMDKYGDAVRAQYILPTEEELNIVNGVEGGLDLNDENNDGDREIQPDDDREMLLPEDEMTD
jgi:hypothetical protein